MQYLNIGHLVKGDDIGLLSLKDGQSLFGRTGMRLPNRQFVVGMGLSHSSMKGLLSAVNSSRATS